MKRREFLAILGGAAGSALGARVNIHLSGASTDLRAARYWEFVEPSREHFIFSRLACPGYDRHMTDGDLIASCGFALM